MTDDLQTLHAHIMALQQRLAACVVTTAQLRESAATAHAVLELAPDAIIIVDVHGTILMANAQTDALFGYDRDRLLGQPIECLVPPALHAIHQAHRAAYAAAPHTRPIGAGVDLVGRRADGSDFPVEISLSPFRIGPEILVTAIIRDVSVRTTATHSLTAQLAAHQQLETTLHDAVDLAEAANQAKSDFLTRMSHELRTPLNAILGFTQLLQMDDLSPEQQANLGYILSGGQHLLTLINEVLDIASIDAGHITLAPEPVRVQTVVLEAMATMHPLAAARGITIRADLEAIGDRMMVVDRKRVTQVLLNLLSNAVKYNQAQGQIQLTGTVVDDRLQLAIIDQGIGIPAEQLGKLFVPFARLGQEHTLIEGTGLGLALTKRLVEAMDGTITARSVVGSGSTFTLTFPLMDTVAPILAGAAPDRRVGRAPLSTTGQQVLLIDDNLAHRRLLEQLLGPPTGIVLLTATTGAMGLVVARAHQPALILLDLGLPDMDGEAVFAALRADPATRAIPVVIVTADTMARQPEWLLASGARAYLTKPLDVPHFLHTVSDLLAPGGA